MLKFHLEQSEVQNTQLSGFILFRNFNLLSLRNNFRNAAYFVSFSVIELQSRNFNFRVCSLEPTLCFRISTFCPLNMLKSAETSIVGFKGNPVPYFTYSR